MEAKYKNKEYDQLAKELLSDPKYAGKTVLISWHHATSPTWHMRWSEGRAKKWDDEVFDRVWQPTYEKGVPSWKDEPEGAVPAIQNESPIQTARTMIFVASSGSSSRSPIMDVVAIEFDALTPAALTRFPT